jgi:hypothetical protein
MNLWTLVFDGGLELLYIFQYQISTFLIKLLRRSPFIPIEPICDILRSIFTIVMGEYRSHNLADC